MLCIAAIVDFWFRGVLFRRLGLFSVTFYYTFMPTKWMLSVLFRVILRGHMLLLPLLQTFLGSQGRENQPRSNNYLRPRHTIPFISSVHLFLVIFSQVAFLPGILNDFLFSQGLQKFFSGKQTWYCSQENVALIITDIYLFNLLALSHWLSRTE